MTALPAWADGLPEDMVDPHVHQWDPLTTTRVISREARLLKRVERVPSAVTRLFPQADREFVGDPSYVIKPYLPSSYAADAGELPVRTVVHVEASWPHDAHLESVDETRWVTSLPFGVDGAPHLGGLVVHIDPRWSDAGAVLDAHAEVSDLVRGARLSGAHHPDPGVRDFVESPGAWSEPAFLDGFEAVASRGLSFELWGYAHQLPAMLPLVRAYPETTFVLDHHGTPVGAVGPRGKHTGRYPHQRREQLAAWREDVAALAAEPNVVAKQSGLGMPVLGWSHTSPLDVPALSGEVLDAVAPLVTHVHECFGPDRVMWASNYPMDKPTFTLPATLALLVEVLGDDLDLVPFTRDVARRVYRLG